MISAQRTRFGVEEMTHALLGVERPSEDELTAARTRIADALRHLAAAAMPLVALLLARPALGGPADSAVPGSQPGAARLADRGAGRPRLRPGSGGDAGASRSRDRRPTAAFRSYFPHRRTVADLLEAADELDRPEARFTDLAYQRP